MADYIVVEVLEAIVWCVEQTVFTFVGVIEGIVSLLAYIPAVIENSLVLFELFILGMWSSLKFVIYSLFYAVSFMINLPEHLADALLLLESGVGEGFRWTLSAISFVFRSVVWFLLQIFVLLKQLVVATLEYTANSIQLVFFSTINVFHNAASYLIMSTETFLLNLTDKLKQVIVLPVLLSQNFVEVLNNAAKTVFIKASNIGSSLWKLPAFAFNKLLSGLQYCLTFFYHFKEEQERVAVPHPGVDWLARFSQLMLTFSFIIFILVATVVLYHMRYKIFASLATVLNLVLTKLSILIRRGENNGGNFADRERPQLVQDQRELQGESDDENVGYEVESSDEDTQTVWNRHTVQRGGSKEREHQPSTSSGSSRKYKTLLQQERDKQLCVVCQDNEKNTLLFPCKHLCVCDTCVEQITSAVNLNTRRCPICRGKINSYMDVFT